MPVLAINEATEKLAKVVETAKASTLVEIYAELYPEKPAPDSVKSADIVRHIRNGIAAEEVVDLWNVVFPEDHHVWYNEETKAIHYNEELVGSVD
jgi:hypothetical protein